LKKEHFKRLLGSVKQAGKIMRGHKLRGMKTSYYQKPGDVWKTRAADMKYTINGNKRKPLGGTGRADLTGKP
jgi:hypothetical protein